MNHIRNTLIIALATLLYSTSQACEIKVSWEPWAPYQYKEGDKLTGLDIELTEAIAKEAGCKISFQELPWARQLKMNEDGSIDVVMAASKTKEREAWGTFGETYRKETISLWIKKGGPVKNISSLDDLKKIPGSVGVVRENAYGDAADALIKADKKKFEETENDVNNFKKLASGRVDAVLSDEFTGYSTLKSEKLDSQIEKSSFSVSSSPVYLMVSKKSKVAGLSAKLDKAIKDLSAKGEIEKLITKYRK